MSTMNKKSGRVAQGVVKDFNFDTLVGVVELGSQTHQFHSTSFQSDTTLRFPRRGEAVEVVMTSSGGLLSVHGK